jgi:hypothetical protein
MDGIEDKQSSKRQILHFPSYAESRSYICTYNMSAIVGLFGGMRIGERERVICALLNELNKEIPDLGF